MSEHAHDDPYARVFDMEADDFDDYYAHEDLVERAEFGYEAFGCFFPSQCCMPGPHYPSDCVSVEVMEDLFAEAELEAEAAGALDPVDRLMADSEEGPF
ncbi:hypothetical protein GBA63_21755 (plasmid) [Rubrobacter tropicus]|uniref:Uncharacterized protein n=1 Tax=Rubrobacter tropicus TaxID=2653851 RepID=A0A6G8QGK2_9ACTN|nr:hypothetical protein [Rubrobacter tropicus]QIN85347.1 hypothetical protein GBA63_21755 [Rubrobacter tropicus]